MQRYGFYGATTSFSLEVVSKPYRGNAAEDEAFVKFTLRKPIDFAIIGVTSVLTMEKVGAPMHTSCRGCSDPTR